MILGMNTIPMPSTKISEGVNEVIGTSTGCTVERNVSRSAITRWRLFSNGRLVRSFRTKRDALAYCQDHPEL
jgi:hypothetical protein